MNEKELILDKCIYTLNNPTRKLYDDIDYGIFVFNKYNLDHIPSWLYEMISICTEVNSHISVVIFDELMNSISARRFNNEPIPSSYIIVPEDWIDCYEDGYPLINIDRDLFDEYNTRYNNLLTNASHEDLITYINFLSNERKEKETSYMLHHSMMSRLKAIYSD